MRPPPIVPPPSAGTPQFRLGSTAAASPTFRSSAPPSSAGTHRSLPPSANPKNSRRSTSRNRLAGSRALLSRLGASPASLLAPRHPRLSIFRPHRAWGILMARPLAVPTHGSAREFCALCALAPMPCPCHPSEDTSLLSRRHGEGPQFPTDFPPSGYSRFLHDFLREILTTVATSDSEPVLVCMSRAVRPRAVTVRTHLSVGMVSHSTGAPR